MHEHELLKSEEEVKEEKKKFFLHLLAFRLKYFLRLKWAVSEKSDRIGRRRLESFRREIFCLTRKISISCQFKVIFLQDSIFPRNCKKKSFRIERK
jgi:hypothetical protein